MTGRFDLRAYLDIKIIAAVLVILYAIYAAFTEIPTAWKQYNDANAMNSQLQNTKQNYGAMGVKLKQVSNVLDDVETKIVQVEDAASAQLAVISVVQKVVQLSDMSKNTYMGLSPAKDVKLSPETSVKLPPSLSNVPGAPAAANVNTTSQATNHKPGAPAPANDNTLSALQYQLQLRGTYANLAQFIYQLCKFKRLVLINSIGLKPMQTAPNPLADSKASTLNEVGMTLTFIVPWQIGPPLPDETVSIQPQATPNPTTGPDLKTQQATPLQNTKPQSNTPSTAAQPQYPLVRQPGAPAKPR